MNGVKPKGEEDQPLPEQTVAIGPWEIVRIIVRSFGRTLPVVVILIAIILGAGYAYKELKLIQDELTKKKIEAAQSEANAKVAALTAVNKEFTASNEILLKTSKEIQNLLTNQINNMHQIEKLRNEISAKIKSQQEGIEKDLAAKQDSLKRQIKDLEDEKRKVKEEVKNLKKDYEEKLNRYETDLELAPIRMKIKEITASFKNNVYDGIQDGLRSFEKIDSFSEEEIKEIENTLEKTEDNHLKSFLLIILYKVTNLENWRKQMQDFLNQKKYHLDPRLWGAFKTYDWSLEQKKKILPFIGEQIHDKKLRLNARIELMNFFRYRLSYQATMFDLIPDKTLFFDIMSFAIDVLLNVEIDYYYRENALDLIYNFEPAAYHVWASYIIASDNNQDLVDRVEERMKNRAKVLAILKNNPPDEIKHFWSDKSLNAPRTVYPQKGWTQDYRQKQR